MHIDIQNELGGISEVDRNLSNNEEIEELIKEIRKDYLSFCKSSDESLDKESRDIQSPLQIVCKNCGTVIYSTKDERTSFNVNKKE